MQDKTINLALADDGEMESQALISSVETQFVAQADTDAQVVELWLHGRSRHTQRAYRASVERFFAYIPKTLRQVSLGDVQAWSDSLSDSLADSSRAQGLAAIKSLLAFAHKIGYTT